MMEGDGLISKASREIGFGAGAGDVYDPRMLQQQHVEAPMASRPQSVVECQMTRIDDILSDVERAVSSAESKFDGVVLNYPAEGSPKAQADPETMMSALPKALSSFADRLSNVRYRLGSLVDRAEL
jgi:hypothetical protein